MAAALRRVSIDASGAAGTAEHPRVRVRDINPAEAREHEREQAEWLRQEAAAQDERRARKAELATLRATLAADVAAVRDPAAARVLALVLARLGERA